MNKVLVMICVLALVLSGCTPDGELYEMTMQADYSEMLEDFSRPNSVEFKEVLAKAKEQGRGNDLTESFFSEAQKLYPNKPLHSYFRNVHGIRPGMSNKQVRQKIGARKKSLLKNLIKRINSEKYPEGITISKATQVGNGKVKLEFYSTTGSRRVQQFFIQENSAVMYEVYMWGELASLVEKIEYKKAPPEVKYRADSTSIDSTYAFEDLNLDAPSSSIWSNLTFVGSGSIFAFCTISKIDVLLDSLNAPSFIGSNDLKFFKGNDREISQGKLPIYGCKVANNNALILSSEFVESATAKYDTENGEHMVSILMTDKGRDIFAKLTSENVGEAIAIVVNDTEVISAPNVLSPIANGEVQISGSMTKMKAKNLAYSIGSPDWGLPLYLVEEPRKK